MNFYFICHGGVDQGNKKRDVNDVKVILKACCTDCVIVYGGLLFKNSFVQTRSWMHWLLWLFGPNRCDYWQLKKRLHGAVYLSNHYIYINMCIQLQIDWHGQEWDLDGDKRSSPALYCSRAASCTAGGVWLFTQEKAMKGQNLTCPLDGDAFWLCCIFVFIPSSLYISLPARLPASLSPPCALSQYISVFSCIQHWPGGSSQRPIHQLFPGSQEYIISQSI